MSLVGTLPTLSWVENFATAHLSAAAGRWSATANLWEQSFTQLAADMLRPGGYEWEGSAAEAAQSGADQVQFNSRGAASQLSDAAKIASFGADQLDGLHQKTLAAIADARADGFEVGEDLSVIGTTVRPADSRRTKRTTEPRRRTRRVDPIASWPTAGARQRIRPQATGRYRRPRKPYSAQPGG